jgi:hypothetical protein
VLLAALDRIKIPSPENNVVIETVTYLKTRRKKIFWDRSIEGIITMNGTLQRVWCEEEKHVCGVRCEERCWWKWVLWGMTKKNIIWTVFNLIREEPNDCFCEYEDVLLHRFQEQRVYWPAGYQSTFKVMTALHHEGTELLCSWRSSFQTIANVGFCITRIIYLLYSYTFFFAYTIDFFCTHRTNRQ